MSALDLTSDVIKAAAVVLEDCVREAVLDLVASCDTIVELEALIEAAEVVQVIYCQLLLFSKKLEQNLT